MFVINLYAIASLLWLVSSFAHFIIAWNNFNECHHPTNKFWIENAIGFGVLVIAFITMWIIHLPIFIHHLRILSLVFTLLITAGLPVAKITILKLYTDLKVYREE